MNDAVSWIPVAAPIVGAVLVATLGQSDRGAQRAVALVASLIALATSCLAFVAFDSSVAGYQLASHFAGSEKFGIALAFGYDAISLPLVLMANVVGVCAVLTLRATTETGATARNDREHFALLLLALGSCNGAFLSLNLFFFFFFCELGTLPKYLLVARWWRRQQTERDAPGAMAVKPANVAMQMTVYILLGAMAFLGVIVLLAAKLGGSLEFEALSKAAPALDAELQATLYLVLVFALGVWSGIWPLHAWAPAAYATAQAPTNMLFAGVAKGFGLYGLLRIGSSVLPAGAAAASELVMVLGMINVLYAGWASLKQTDWNRLLAYASISHAGYTFIAVSTGTAMGYAAAVTLMCAHGLVTSLGFLLTDELDNVAGHRDVSRLGGLAHGAPMLSVAFCVFAVAGAGFPGTAGFVAELMVFFAAWDAGTVTSQAAAVVCVFGVILSATYLYRALHATFFGPAKPKLPLDANAPSLHGLPLVATVVLTLSTVVLGVYPRMLTDLFVDGAAAAANGAEPAKVAAVDGEGSQVERSPLALPERVFAAFASGAEDAPGEQDSEEDSAPSEAAQ
jgi:NADH-quinone oxidoreductase subunit M